MANKKKFKFSLTCCDRIIRTDFCPHCGKPSHAAQLDGLLDHCEREAAKVAERYQGKQPHSVGFKRWDSWTKLLAQMLSK